MAGEQASGEDWVELSADGQLAEMDWRVSVLTARVQDTVQVVGLQLAPLGLGESELARAILSTEKLRRFPLRAVKAAAAKVVCSDYLDGGDTRPDRPGPDGRWTSDHYALVRVFYETALEARTPPGPLIQDAWGVSRATASKWIDKARKEHGLGYPDKVGRAGHSEHPGEEAGDEGS